MNKEKNDENFLAEFAEKRLAKLNNMKTVRFLQTKFVISTTKQISEKISFDDMFSSSFQRDLTIAEVDLSEEISHCKLEAFINDSILTFAL